MTPLWEQDLCHQVKLIKNNDAISSWSKQRMTRLVEYYLTDAVTTIQIKSILSEISELQSKDSALNNSFAAQEVIRHITRAI